MPREFQTRSSLLRIGSAPGNLGHGNTPLPETARQTARASDTGQDYVRASVGASLRVTIWFVACSAFTRHVLAAEQAGPAPRQPSPLVAAGAWTVTQLVPSPLLVTSSHHVGAGVRWQVTPVLYSFGVTAHPWRAFVVPPSVRHSGSVELFGSPEWACCAPTGNSSWLGRVGSRVYLPLVERGEALSWSFGGSYYRASSHGGAAAELGIYTLYGVFGITVTVSPALARREVITALSVRYF
jgi:hypothetical protein